MNDYIVSYCGGSSGRLVNMLVLFAINNIDKPIPITDENSAHLGPSNHEVTIDLPERFNYRTDTFSLIKWNKAAYANSSMWTHASPNFDDIRANPQLANTKIIFIRVSPPDFVETASNLANKAYIPTLKKYQSLTSEAARNKELQNCSVMFKRVTAALIEKLNMRVDELDPSSTELTRIVKDIILDTPDQHNHFLRFTDIEIPDDFTDRVLVLEFSDLKSTVGLAKIKEFIQNDLSTLPQLEKSYVDYVENQKQLIKIIYPWIE